MSTRLEREYMEANSIEELHHALLINAATSGDMHAVRELVEVKLADVNYINEATRKFYARQAGTALLAACESDRTEVALYLLRCGADPAISGRIPFTGMTVLHFVAYYGNVEVMAKVVEFLIAKKGKEVLLKCVTASDHFGLTPLHWAAWAWQIVQELLNLGKEFGLDWTSVKTEIAPVRGLTPLHLSFMCQHASCLIENLNSNYKHFLLEQVSNPDLDENRLTRVTELLLTRGADILARDGRLLTPLHYLALEGTPSMIDTVLGTYLKWEKIDEDDAEGLKEISERLWPSRDIYTQNIFDISYERGNFESSHVIQRLVRAWMGLPLSDTLTSVTFDAFARLRSENSAVQQERLEELTKNCACELNSCPRCSREIKACLLEDHREVCRNRTHFACPSRAYGCTEVLASTGDVARHLLTCPASRVMCCLMEVSRSEYCEHYVEEHIKPNSQLSVMLSKTDLGSVENDDILCPACRMIIPGTERERHVCAVTAVVPIDPIDIV